MDFVAGRPSGASGWNTSSQESHNRMPTWNDLIGLVRYEWLSQHYWQDLDEVQLYATKWMWKYNHDRPNMALGGITPKQRLAMAA